MIQWKERKKKVFFSFLNQDWFLIDFDPGKPCKINYGSGMILGFFSEDNIKVGDLVVQNQVGAFSFSSFNILLFNLSHTVCYSCHLSGIYRSHKRRKSYSLFGKFWWDTWTWISGHFCGQCGTTLVRFLALIQHNIVCFYFHLSVSQGIPLCPLCAMFPVVTITKWF